MSRRRPAPTPKNEDYGPSDLSRFGWSSLDEIRPLHSDGQPYDEAERAEMKNMKEHAAASGETLQEDDPSDE